MGLLKKLLFFLLLFALVCGEVFRIDNGQSIAVTLLDISVFFSVVVACISYVFQKRTITLFIEKYTLFFVGVGVLSLLLNLHSLSVYTFFVSLLYAVRFVFYTVGVSIVIQTLDAKTKKQLPYFLAGVSGVLAVLGFVQYFFYPSLANLYYAGWDKHLYRLFSTFLDPNFMGLFFALGAILCFRMVIYTHANHIDKRYVFFLCSLLLTSGALFLTYSRSAYVTLTIGLLYILYRLKLKKLLLTMLCILLVVIVSIGFLGHKTEGTNILRTASVLSRFTSVSEAETIFLKHPVFGVGFDSYRYAQEKLGFLTQNLATTHAGAGTDNSFLFVLATTGLVGLSVYLVVTYKILMLGYRKDTLLGSILLPSYLALAIGSFFVNGLFFPFLLVWVWILIGATENNSH